MTIVPIEEAQDHLADLVKKAVNGEPFIISEAGKPLVTVAAVVEPLPVEQQRRIGFLEGHLKVPDDFDTMYQDEIIALFEGDE